MIQSLFNGASGLRANQTQMDTIGNNIANVNTTGYKESRTDFQQVLSSTVRGASATTASVGGTDPVQMGLGVAVGDVAANQSQGALQSTGRPLDVAIQGNGFLTLSDGSGQFFTRDGSLSVDANGSLVSSATGMRVMGWNADPATNAVNPQGQPVAVQLPLGQMAVARATSQVTYNGNLDATAAPGATAATSFTAFDSLGQGHTVNVTFTRGQTSGQWTWKAVSPDGSFGTTDSGTLTFDANGRVKTGGTASPTMTLAAANPGAPMKLNLDFSGVNGLAGSGQSTVAPASQDGLAAGTLTGFAIDASGVINGTFSNGLSQALAQIAVADFPNPGGLTKAQGNTFAASANTGTALIGAPDTGGRGKLASGFLEMSNVDLATEFTNMIIAQRGFQANAKVITASDELLQDLVGMKR